MLLAKLEFCGIKGVTGKLHKSHLTDRRQRTLTNNNNSSGVSKWLNVGQGPTGLYSGAVALFSIH
jgi:hypothetical protein